MSKELKDEIAHLKANNLAMRSDAMHCPRCNDTGEWRYWEGRWRDEHTLNAELLAALERVVDEIGPEIDLAREIIIELRAAVAKAKGEE